MAMFNKPNSLAFSSSVLPCAAPIICAILFQWPGGVSVPAPSAQNRAICVWSEVRVELVAAPSCLTSFMSAAYFALVRAGGPAGRNCALLFMQEGLRDPHSGHKQARK